MVYGCIILYYVILCHIMLYFMVLSLFPPSHFRRQVDSWDDASGDFVPVLGEEAQGFERLGSRDGNETSNSNKNN